MSVRAKFKVDEVRRHLGSKPKLDADGNHAKGANGYPEYEPCELRTVVLSPVYGNGDPQHENTKFWQASPSGRIELTCINLAAAERFELGREYYVDFTAAV